MSYLLHHLLHHQAGLDTHRTALGFKQHRLSYSELSQQVQQTAGGLRELGLGRGERIAVYLPKQFETVTALFAASQAGAAFVPINPVLKPLQVQHILADCNVRILVTSNARWQQLTQVLEQLPDLRQVVLVDACSSTPAHPHYSLYDWQTLQHAPLCAQDPYALTDHDMAAILYTSGSTGKPKGVVLSQRNMMVGAQSVASYLNNSREDRILSLLPLSFDAGLSQITTAFYAGASCYLLDYLLPNDVLNAVQKHAITGITAVPPLWMQLANLKWTRESAGSVRYIANTGGHMPQPLLEKLQSHFCHADPYLMYGLTEAFRSTYLAPSELLRKPGSMGKAIPNAEILVVRDDGSRCAPNEPGELVHRGPLVSQGYWNDPQRTAERFRPVPDDEPGMPGQERAVWSGDTVRCDEEGFLYFVGRQDEMIKTSGYRVSPNEVEEVVYHSGLVRDVVALGIAHPTLGQAIVLVVTPGEQAATDTAQHLSDTVLNACRRALPNFMQPQTCVVEQTLPRNPNGKFDRKQLAQQFSQFFDTDH